MTDIIKLIKRLLQISCLVIIDLLAFYTSLLIAWALRGEIMPLLISDLLVFEHSYTHYIAFWWIPVIFIFFIFYEGLYDSNLPFWDETRAVVKSVSLASITILAILTLGKMGEIVSRLVMLGLWISSLFVFPVFRLWGKRYLYTVGIWRERILIIGAGTAGKLVMEGLEREKHMGYDIVGFLDDNPQKFGEDLYGKKVLGNVAGFPRFISELGIRTVVIAIPSLPPEKLSVLTAEVQNYTVNTMVIPDMKGIALLNTDLSHLFIEELFLMNIRNNLKSVTNRFVKRFFDIAVSIVFMPVLLPLIGIIGIIIRLDSPGFAIYAHDRIGKHGKPFRCYKFRTMHRDAEEQLKEILNQDDSIRNEWLKNWKLKDDPRLTQVGRFLRKTSLDELPQIFNVMKGEMSLVGPRPVTGEEIERHYKEAAELCFSVLPGITGLWQISGRTNTGYKHRVRLDSWYIMNWSLWLDIAILFKTMKVVIKAEGAY